MKTAILIPALNPDRRLIDLVAKLRKATDSTIVIVDDGSTKESTPIFETLKNSYGCIIEHHAENMGKGEALKTGIRCAMRQIPRPAGIVSADADGQHLPQDILRVSAALRTNPNSLILGVRNFSSRNVPFKSRWGNKITSFVFFLTTKIRCPDTQTGLRAIPASLAEFCLSVPGSRFEYEMNMLTCAAKKGIPLITVPISTVYLESNRSSHFRAVRDSALVYSNFLKFGASSLLCAGADLGLFTLLTYGVFGRSAFGILAGTVSARCVSGVLNFTINKKWCFSSRGNSVKQAVKYFILFCTQMLLSWAIVTLLAYLPAHLTLLKMLADGGLFILSFFIQKKFIFKTNTAGNKTPSNP